MNQKPGTPAPAVSPSGRNAIKLAEATLAIVKLLAPVSPGAQRRILVFLEDAAREGTSDVALQAQVEVLERAAQALGIKV